MSLASRLGRQQPPDIALQFEQLESVPKAYGGHKTASGSVERNAHRAASQLYESLTDLADSLASQHLEWKHTTVYIGLFIPPPLTCDMFRVPQWALLVGAQDLTYW